MEKYMKENRLQLILAGMMLAFVAFGVLDPATAMAGGMLLTTTGQLGNGTVVQVSSGSPTSLVTIGNCRNVEFDTGSSAKVDMSNMSSSWKEFLLGLPDPGSLTFDVDTDFGDAGQATLRAARISRVRCDFKVILPGGTTPNASMQGFVSKFPVTTSVDNPVKTSVECFLTGPITLA